MRALLLAIAVVCACKPRPDPTRACIAGDTEACERACAEGIAGEGGCHTLGQRKREPEAAGGGNGALGAFRKGCLGGHLAACTEAIDGIRAKATQVRYAQKHEGAPSDPFVEEAERGLVDLIDRACSLGAASRCEELSRLMLGRDATRAASASERYCALPEGGGKDGSCLGTRKRWIAEVEADRPGCEAGQVEACNKLAEHLITAHSDDNAVEAFARACDLRGFDVEALFPDVPLTDCNDIPYEGRRDHAGARGRCGMRLALAAAERRSAREHGAAVDATEAGAEPKPGPGPRAKVTLGAWKTFGGGYPAVALAEHIERLSPRLRPCNDAGPGPEGDGVTTFEIGFMIDRFGATDFSSVHHVSGNHHAWKPVKGCVLRVLRSSTYPPPPSGKGVALVVPISIETGS
ncbi:hypothetical protein [Polyangium sorediatum]|uniref:Uncharacterized protein n=1 Tax=Polyangium sorediatum TaxID=889274 RepID=A0ABT6NJR5_9BACT|nr:hypothetical protein [Polyangium sorediatum]MDI1428549.1 hypothetical protein [Polyangium sorediatum]